MGNFGRGGGYGGGNKFGGNRGFGDRDRPQMHRATCDKCGRECEVPFKPTGERPVYCKDCFRKESPESSGKFGGHDSGRPSFEEKRMFEATCDKCGNRCEVPFRPTGEKPVYCRACFGKNDGGRPERSADRSPDQFKAQFEILNSKLDKIMRLLAPSQPQAPIAAKPMKEVITPKAMKAPTSDLVLDAAPIETAEAPKAKKAVGKKASAKKAAKTGK